MSKDLKDFYSHLNAEDSTGADYVHAKRVCNDLVECHNLNVQSDTLLLADAFENFRNMYLKIYKLDPTGFLSSP